MRCEALIVPCTTMLSIIKYDRHTNNIYNYYKRHVSICLSVCLVLFNNYTYHSVRRGHAKSRFVTFKCRNLILKFITLTTTDEFESCMYIQYTDALTKNSRIHVTNYMGRPCKQLVCK